MTKALHITESADGTREFTPAALRKIEAWAAEGKTIAYIASQVEVPVRLFNSMMERSKGENSLRLAYERGRAAKEQEHLDYLEKAVKGTCEETEDVSEAWEDHPEHGKILVRTIRRTETWVQSKGAAVQHMFLMKTQYGWNEKPEGAGTGNDNRVTINLPKPQTREEYFAMLGITGPMDFSKPKPREAAVEPPPLVDLTRPDDETIRARVRALTTPKPER